MNDKQKRIALIVGGLVAAYLAYRYFSNAGSSTSTTAAGPASTDGATSSDYASLAGQEQSDVAALGGQEQTDIGTLSSSIAGVSGQEQSDVAALQGQEGTDVASLTGQIGGLGAQLSDLYGQVQGLATPTSSTQVAVGAAPANRKAAHKHRTSAAKQNGKAQGKRTQQMHRNAPKHQHPSPNRHVAGANHAPKPTHPAAGANRAPHKPEQTHQTHKPKKRR